MCGGVRGLVICGRLARVRLVILTVLLEDTEDLDDDLRRGADEHLALAAALGVDWGQSCFVDPDLARGVCLHTSSVRPSIVSTSLPPD